MTSPAPEPSSRSSRLIHSHRPPPGKVHRVLTVVAGLGALCGGYTAAVAIPRVGRKRQGEDEFARRFRIVLDELTLADQVTSAELQQAHVAGNIPPWTIAGDELYVVITTRRLWSPGLVVAITHRMLYLAGLLMGRSHNGSL